MRQDVAFGFRQLVDMAEKALSPAVNDPTTASQAINRIHDLLRRIALAPDPCPVYRDGDGTARLLIPVHDWAEIVHLAFDEIRRYGSDSLQVHRLLRHLLDDLDRARRRPARAPRPARRAAVAARPRPPSGPSPIPRTACRAGLADRPRLPSVSGLRSGVEASLFELDVLVVGRVVVRPEHDLVEEDVLQDPEDAEAGDVGAPCTRRSASVECGAAGDFEATTTTRPVDRHQPATVNAQNGRTSRRMCARPRLPHTQYLLRQKAGIDVIIVAARLAGTGWRRSSTPV